MKNKLFLQKSLCLLFCSSLISSSSNIAYASNTKFDGKSFNETDTVIYLNEDGLYTQANYKQTSGDMQLADNDLLNTTTTRTYTGYNGRKYFEEITNYER